VLADSLQAANAVASVVTTLTGRQQCTNMKGVALLLLINLAAVTVTGLKSLATRPLKYLPLAMVEPKGPDGTTVPSDKLVWDPKAGRFFERNLEEVCEEEFCLLDEETGKPILLTREEKERVFLDSIQQYYYSGKSTLPDDQFDRLREDLAWEGSLLVNLKREETLFMNAAIAYRKGTPIISDTEYDQLKKTLKENNSKIAVQTDPQCYVDTGVCKVTWTPDTVRTTSLYIPATLLITILYLGIFSELPVLNQINPLILLLFGAAPISQSSKFVTEDVFFKNPYVAGGPCPSCGVENRVFFGDVLGVQGDKEEGSCKCSNCKAGMTVRRSTLRVSTLISKKGPAVAAAAAAADEE